MTGLDDRASGLPVVPTVDGWSLTIRGPRGLGALGRGGVGLGLLMGLGGIGAIALTSAEQLPVLVGVGLALLGGLLFTGGTASGLAPSRVSLKVGAHHLDLDGVPGRGRVRIPWSQLADVWVGDVRDTWEQAFQAQFQLQDPEERTRELDRPTLGLRLRWTEDGRPAAFAHEATPWARLELGRGLSAQQLAWLADALHAARADAADTQAQAAFSDAVQGRPSARARAALDDLRGRDG